MTNLRFFILTIFISAAYSLHSQVLEFRDITPSWSYSFKEKSTSDTTNHINIFNIVERNGKYIVVGSSEEPYSNVKDWYGVTLACLDQAGNELWYSSYQTFENNDSIHVFFPNVNNLVFNSSEIQLFGYQRKHIWTDTPGRTDSWSLYGAEEMYPHDISIDLQSGTLTDICYGDDTLTIGRKHTDVPTFMNGKGKLIKTTIDVHPRTDSSFIGEFKSTLGYNFYDYNSACSFLESEIIDTILFLPDDTVKLHSIETYPLLIQPDPNTLLVNIWFERYSNDPKQYLLWIDISDVNDISLIEMQELNHLIPRSNERLIFFNIQSKNKQVILSHPYNDQGKRSSYLLWLNNKREVKKVIAPCQIEDHRYTYIDLVHANETELLCLGFPSRAPNRGYDLLRVTEDEDSLIFIKSIVPEDDNIYYNFLSGTVSKSGDEIILGMYVFQVENNTTIYNDRQEVHAFRLSDLTSNLYKRHQKSKPLYLHPNPAHTTASFDSAFTIQKIVVRNVSGQTVSIQHKAGDNEIDVSQIPAGLYFIQAQDIDGNWYQSKLIKH